MRSVALGFLLTVILVAGCSRSAPPVPPTKETPSGTFDVGQVADIYAAVLLGSGEGATQGVPMYIVDRVCPRAGWPHDLTECAPMDPDVKAAMAQRFPDARFISNPDPLQKRLLQKGGVVVYLFGPIERFGENLRVASSYWCGGTCGKWATYVVAHTNGGWTVTGTIGGVGVA